MFSDKPFSEAMILPSAVQVIAVPYTYSTDDATDKSNADAALAKSFLLWDITQVSPVWSAKNGGIKEYKGTNGAITSVARGGNGTPAHPTGGTFNEALSDVVITMFNDWEGDSSTPRDCYPVVEYAGKPIPFSDYRHLGDGFSTGDDVIVIDNTGTKYGPAVPVEADWKVTLYKPVLGLVSAELGGKPLAQTTTTHNLLGIENPAFSRTVNDGGPGSGNIVVIENIGRMRVADGIANAAEVLNFPGQDLEKTLYGSNWAEAGQKALSYQSDTQRLCIALVAFNSSFPNLHTATAADQNQVFAKVLVHYGCRITDIQNVQNVASGSSDMVQRQVNFEWRDVQVRVFKTGA